MTVPTRRPHVNRLPWAAAAAGEARVNLKADAVHVWAADLDAIGKRVEKLLDRQELDRAGRIVREPAQRRWMAARGGLRALLGAYVDERPTALRFALEANGKPVLDSPRGRLHFNMSHSGWLAVYAVTAASPVGIDVELIVRPNGRRRRPDSLRAWTIAEAEAKRIGVGVRGSMRNALAHASSGESRPWISELDLGAAAVGAIALASVPVDFQVYAIDF